MLSGLHIALCKALPYNQMPPRFRQSPSIPTGSVRSLVSSILLFQIAGVASFGQLDSLDRLTLEELGEVPVILSSKNPTQLFEAPVGSFVFDEEAIESLPVDSIAEMLRYAPGVHIIRPSNGIWGVGMRGINSRFFNRVEFNVDEQNVYSSIFSGLFGNQHDLLLDDIASVEVVYGPAGGTWDNNAVNGMVNVLKKTGLWKMAESFNSSTEKTV